MRSLCKVNKWSNGVIPTSCLSLFPTPTAPMCFGCSHAIMEESVPLEHIPTLNPVIQAQPVPRCTLLYVVIPPPFEPGRASPPPRLNPNLLMPLPMASDQPGPYRSVSDPGPESTWSFSDSDLPSSRAPQTPEMSSSHLLDATSSSIESESLPDSGIHPDEVTHQSLRSKCLEWVRGLRRRVSSTPQTTRVPT